MSTTVATPSLVRRPLGVWDTTVGKKAVMAVTGFVLYGFVIGHLLGNLQVYQGREAVNHYAEFLHSKPGLLWMARIGLILATALHVTAAVQLALRKRAARPRGYVSKRNYQEASYASRTMYWSGPILLAFIIYHLLHFTTGTVHPEFSRTDVYGNLVLGFQRPLVSIFYILSMVLLGFHLYHGVWSMFQSLGVNSRSANNAFRLLAKGSAAFLALGNISIPVAVLAGLIRY